MLCLTEASKTASGSQLRFLFAVMLIFATSPEPRKLFDNFRQTLSDDFEFSCHSNPVDAALRGIETLLAQHGKTLFNFGLLAPTLFVCSDRFDAETAVSDQDKEVHRNKSVHCIAQLNLGQRQAFDQIIAAFDAKRNEVFFLDGLAGTGKTFVYNTLLSEIRSRCALVIAVASSVIEATLLDRGCTAHS